MYTTLGGRLWTPFGLAVGSSLRFLHSCSANRAVCVLRFSYLQNRWKMVMKMYTI